MSRSYLHLAIVGIILVVMIFAASASGSSSTTNTGRSAYPRSNRGFRNSQLSTARGFGKRDSGSLAASRLSSAGSPQNLSPSNEGFFPGNFESSRSSSLANRLLEELQNNPEELRYFVERCLKEVDDGEFAPGEMPRPGMY